MKFVHNEEYSLPRYVKYYPLAVLATVVMFATVGCASHTVEYVSAAPVVTGEPAVVTAELSAPVSPEPTKPYDVWRGPNYTDRVVLTYDDCPKSRTQLQATVATAKAHDIGLVLAPTGNCLRELGADVVRLMLEHGQYVINHSVSHPALSTLSPGGIAQELGAPGVVSNYGRPPYGDGFLTNPPNAIVAAAYEAVGMKPWLWTVDTNDWQGASAPAIVSYVVANAGKGDTVLMHMNHAAFNPESVLAIWRGLAARGIEVCRAYPGTTPLSLPDSLPC